jgi:beta-exotoxin I transport system permease protein
MGAVEFLTRELRDRTRALVFWCVGGAAYVALIASIFPSIQDSPQLDQLVQDYPEALKSLFGIGGVNLTTGAGYIDTELFNIILPLLVIVLAIGSGSRTLAGEEEAGRLELPFSYPVRRRDGVLAKGLGVAGEVAALCAAIFLALAVLDPVLGLDLSLGRLVGAVLGLAMLGLLHGWLALAVGAARPGRGLAIALPAAAAAVGYLVGGLHELAGWLDPFRFVSSFWWIGQSPLTNGVELARLLVVLAASVVALVAASLLIERRDLQVP